MLQVWSGLCLVLLLAGGAAGGKYDQLTRLPSTRANSQQPAESFAASSIEPSLPATRLGAQLFNQDPPASIPADYQSNAVSYLPAEGVPYTYGSESNGEYVMTVGTSWSSLEPPDLQWPTFGELRNELSFRRLRAMDNEFRWHILPGSLIYKSYLAGAKESRLSAHLFNSQRDSNLWDATLGGRVGLLRYGTCGPYLPRGVQIDMEGSAQLRLDIPEEVDVRSSDFRAGVPITIGWGRQQTKLAYYHLSSHLVDEYMIKNPGYTRYNYARDCLVIGHSVYLDDSLRVYAEAGWAFWSDVCKEWEFQFGLDWAPMAPTGFRGAPFFAINGHLHEELNYGGRLNVQTGWCWRGDTDGHLMRLGLHYQNGASNQFEFYNKFEQQVGFGVWYDY